MNRHHFTLLLLILILCPAWSNAKVSPPPFQEKPSIEDMNKALERHTEEKKRLQADIDALDGDINKVRKTLISLSQSVQKSEKQLIKLNTSIDANYVKQQSLQATLEQDKHDILQLILAMKRLEEVPLAALLIKPGAPIKTAQSALLMEDLTHNLAERSQSFQNTIQELDHTNAMLHIQRDDADRTMKSLNAEKKRLESFMAEKKRIYKQTQSDFEENQLAIARLSKESRSMVELIVKLEERRKKRNQEQKAQEKKALKQAQKLSRFKLSGSERLPISGVVRVAYGEPDRLEAPSKGLWIEGRANGLVVAPMNGTVRFTGPFKNYGNLIIIEHTSGYHSLIAGFEKIEAFTGQVVAAGEPLGYLNSSRNGENPTLYFELRHRGKTIDPAKKFASNS